MFLWIQIYKIYSKWMDRFWWNEGIMKLFWLVFIGYQGFKIPFTENLRHYCYNLFYLRILKKSITIFLFIVICLNHLNIIESLIDYRSLFKKENTQFSNSLSDEENTEKETKAKDQVEEEKYFSRTPFVFINCCKLSDQDKFICFSTQLNRHPHQEEELRPPKTA